MKGHRKNFLPEKTCLTCNRNFKWRKKWAKDWEQVRYCSRYCRSTKTARSDH
ncbi:DUF2256 domain-containing protein [Oceanospirillum sp.]|uniref:DUF2256 domain-containing protein n=1 Tax=Oceanospirillum sp. TaxID=2021254 RepID=UPI003A8DEEF6